MSKNQFWKTISQKGIDLAFAEIEACAHGAAASIVDPATNRHASIFVRRKGNDGYIISTQGSPEFARELEKRLGVERGFVRTMAEEKAGDIPVVYLAHASEDHETLARPLAEGLMAAGIDVWFDAWEIRSGDSLRRKMEEGLGSCSHFLVLLTPNSLGKPGVESEIDVGFVRSVGGDSRFIGLRSGIEIKQLSPFLRSLRCPQIDLSDGAAIDALVADLYGISRKPVRGPKPRYVQIVPDGLGSWSKGAIRVAEYLVRESKDGGVLDPQARMSSVAAALSLPDEDVRLAVLDLEDAGLVERSREIGGDKFWPRVGLFVEFDRHFMDFDNAKDAVDLANRFVSSGNDVVVVSDNLADWFPDWPVRRLNSALAYLEDGKLIDCLNTFGQGPWRTSRVRITDRTLRFVRDHG